MSAALPLALFGWLAGRAVWIALWSTLGIATAVILVLMRTRFRGVKAWKKCALLSLWVHVLAAWLAATVRIVSGGPGLGPEGGWGPPIRVAILTEVAERPNVENTVREEAKPESEATSTNAPALQSPPAPKLPPATPLDAPDLLPQPKPPEPLATKPTTPDDRVVEDMKPTDEAPRETEARSEPSPKLNHAQSPPASKGSDAPRSAGKTSASSRPRALPAAYADRFADNRSALVAGRGGDANTERCVRAALAWLAGAQSADGRWEPAKYGAGHEHYVLGQDRGGAGARAETGISGLALLALLGAGHTQDDGPFADNLARGLQFLRRSQKSDGSLSGDAELFARMYCHSMATFALSEAYAVTHDAELAPVVRAAAGYSLAVQHPTDGGWRYRPGDTGDTSQLGWQLMALKSAQLAGVDVPEVTWTRVERFMRQVERGDSGGLAAYRPEGPPTRTMTAEALYCRQLLAGRNGSGLSRAAVEEAAQSLVEQPPSSEPVNLYYWYYGTLALHGAQNLSPRTAEAWRQWNGALARTLVATQQGDGSWPETCIWGGYGGRIYTTALGAMCLEVYYRYAPTDPGADAAPADVARGEGWQAATPR